METKTLTKRKRISLNDENSVVTGPLQQSKKLNNTNLLANPIVNSLKIENKPENSVDELLAGLDFDDFEDEPIVCNSASNEVDKDVCNEAINGNQSIPLDLSAWTRCIIMSIEKDPKNWNLILIVKKDQIELEASSATCRLQGPWSNTKVAENDIVSIRATWNDKFNCYCVSSEAGLIVTSPDHLISGTSVVGSLFCQRKAVLTDRYTGIDCNAKIMTIGSLLHEIFQIVIKRSLRTIKQIESVCEEILSNHRTILDLYASEISAREARDEVNKFIPKIYEFIQRYLTGNSAVIQKDIFSDKIDSITDIEENIWIPQLGLKGKVDVSVNVRRKNNFFETDIERMPLEIKTGKASFSSEHRGQVFLYQMMMQEIGQKVKSGLLLYLREGITKEISITRNDERDLILLRNEMAFYLTRNNQVTNIKDNISDFVENKKQFEIPMLPDPIHHHSACANCPYSTICCSLLSHDQYNQLNDRNPLKMIRQQVLERLPITHIDYFIRWTGLLALEENETVKGNHIKRMWTDAPETREQNGCAITNLTITGNVVCEQEMFLHEFIKKPSDCHFTQNSLGSIDLTLSGFQVGDYLRVSTSSKYAVAAGRIVSITKKSISMCLERNLTHRYKNSIFTLDRNETNHFIQFNLANLGALIDDRESSNKLRSIIIDRVEATFCKSLPKIIATEGRALLAKLNKIQQQAILKALTANHFMLLKGLPGTGKTQTLVNLVCLFALMGKSVIITSHTNSAVDNVLDRLLKYGLEFIRLGSSPTIANSIQKFRDAELTRNCKTPEDFKCVYEKYNIVGVTCLSSAHPMLIHRKFDVCLVDEATQVMQCTVLRPLMSANRFILVGDPEQLPPLIRSKEARLLGADESLFARLDTESATAILSMQYRMNQTITKLANQLTYNGTLKCATEAVALATMKMPNIQNITEKYRCEKWLLKTLSTHLDLSVLFLNTGNVFQQSIDFGRLQQADLADTIEMSFRDDILEAKKKTDEQRHRIYTNYCEAAVILYLIDKMIEGGVKGTSIGVIAPYRAQVELLRQTIERYTNNATNQNRHGIEVNTVDQYQGRDKEIIFYSCTKCGNPTIVSNQQSINKSTEILEDHRRLTVAITRSKFKLIMVGDVASLVMYSPFEKLFNNLNGMLKMNLLNGMLGFEWERLMNCLSNVLVK